MFSFLINWNFILPMNKLVIFIHPKSNALRFEARKTETEYMGRYLDKFQTYII